MRNPTLGLPLGRGTRETMSGRDFLFVLWGFYNTLSTSSSQIKMRERQIGHRVLFEAGRYLVPDLVQEYIYNKQLYSSGE